MTQPPDQPVPEDRPWQDPDPSRSGPPGSGGSPPQPQEPYGRPPAYGGTYGAPAPSPYGGDAPYDPTGQGGVPQYGGEYGGHQAPATGLASRWTRLAAAIIDVVVLAAIDFVISLSFVNWHRLTHPKQGELISPEQYKLNLIALIIGFFYFWLLTYRWHGQTVGKRLLGIRVVRAHDGGPISNTQALLRALVYAIAGNICGCFGVLDVIWILWDPRKQCLHDKAGKTVVIKAGQGVPDPYATTKY
jgi:uncharacterized RDD family membrane protein YckC